MASDSAIAMSAEERKKDFYENFKLTSSQKVENFDFYEFGEHFTNSVTDKLYRSYLPPLEREHLRRQETFQDTDLSNDFDVDDLVSVVRKKLEDTVTNNITDSVSRRVVKELEEQYHPKPKSVEDYLDKAIKYSRYIITIGFLAVYIIMFALVFLIWAETWEIVVHTVIHFQNIVAGNADRDAVNTTVALILSVLDLMLVGSLVIMVLVGVFENTVSRIGMTHNVPTWFGKLDIGQLKIKVAASIVIISSIHLLVLFMGLDRDATDYNYEALYWTAIVHGVFVVSALALAFMELINRTADKRAPYEDAPSSAVADSKRH